MATVPVSSLLFLCQKKIDSSDLQTAGDQMEKRGDFLLAIKQLGFFMNLGLL